MQKSFLKIITVLIFSALTACTSGNFSGDFESLRELKKLEPVPELTPAEVVTIQLSALKANDEDNQGVAVVFRFSSPRNKMLLGPEERFVHLLQRKPYSFLIDNTSYTLGPTHRRGEVAFVAVRVTDMDGLPQGYIFALVREEGGNYPNCWVTDGVFFINMDSEEEEKAPPSVELNDT